MWFIIKPKGGVVGGAFLKSIFAENEVKQLLSYKIAHRTRIYAVEVEGDELKTRWGVEAEILVKAESLELGPGWERYQIEEEESWWSPDYITIKLKRGDTVIATKVKQRQEKTQPL